MNFVGALPAGVIDENAPHRAGGRAVEVPAILECRLAQADEPEIDLVDKGRGLQRVAAALVAKDGLRQMAEFPVDERHEFFQGPLITGLPPIEGLRDRPRHDPDSIGSPAGV